MTAERSQRFTLEDTSHVTGQNSHSDPNEQRIPHTTTDAGIGAARVDHLLTVGADGPILLQDH
jgi:hypothetical protein